MSKRPSKDSRPILSQQLRQALIGTLKTHLPLDLEGQALDDEKLWEILLYASVNGIAIESACNTLADVPSGNTVRAHLQGSLDPSCFGVFALEESLNEALQHQLPRGVRRRLKGKGWEVGIDLVEIPYHGQPACQEEELCRGLAKSGTTHFHRYATLAIVHHHCRYEVALSFVWADETMDQVVERLLAQAAQVGVRIRRAYLDKGFCRKEVFALLRRHRLPYLIPIPLRGKEGGIRQLFVGRKGYRTTYTFNAGTRQQYTTDVIVLRRYCKGRYGRHQSGWFAYAAYGMEAVPLSQIFDGYRRRFGMESGYRQMHQVRGRTTSPSPTLRLLLIGLAFLIYNAYLLFRQIGRTVRSYGQRLRLLWLTLPRMKQLLQQLIIAKLGLEDLTPRVVPWMETQPAS